MQTTLLKRPDRFRIVEQMSPGLPTSRASTFVLSVALYTAAFIALSWPWLSGALTIPWDAKAQFQPELQFLASSLARGESPFWTPNVFAGWPQIADPQSLIFSPVHLALAALDPSPSFREADFVTFGYLFAGGLGLMLFFRDRGWHPAGGAVAALAFAFGGSAASRLQHTSEIISLAYVPIALWLLARTLERASWRVRPCGRRDHRALDHRARSGRDARALRARALRHRLVARRRRPGRADQENRTSPRGLHGDRHRDRHRSGGAVGAARSRQQPPDDRPGSRRARLAASRAAADAGVCRPVRRRRPECRFLGPAEPGVERGDRRARHRAGAEHGRDLLRHSVGDGAARRRPRPRSGVVARHPLLHRQPSRSRSSMRSAGTRRFSG